MKKNLHFFIISALLLCEALFFGGGNAFADDSGSCGTGVTWTYRESNKKLTISGSGAMNDYSTSNSKTTAPWKNYISEIKSIEIGTNVTKVGAYAFYQCENCTTLTVSRSSKLESIGNRAFYRCTSLTSVKLPAISSIDSYAFYQCTSMTDFFLSPKSTITTYPERMLWGCTGLKNVNIPRNITSIGNYCMYNCTAITNIYAHPASAPTLGTSALYSVPTSAAIKVLNSSASSNYKSATTWSSRSSYISVASSASWTLSTYHTATMIAADRDDEKFIVYLSVKAKSDNKPSGAITLPEGTYAISGMFYYYDLRAKTVETNGYKDITGLTSVTIGSTYETIGANAFSGCSGLKTVTFTATSQVASIGEYAFNGCNNSQFTTITIPESVTSIGSRAFLGCTNLKTVNWNARNCADFTYTTGQYANYSTPFYYNSSSQNASYIQTLNFGPNVEHIPAYLCQGMTNANFTSITIPASVTSVGTSGFGGCTKLTNVNYLGTITQWCGITFASSGSNPLYYGKNLKLNGSNFSTLDIPSEVTNIGAYQFYNAQNVSTLNIPTSVTFVGTEAFKGCSSITTVNYAGSAADWSRINFSTMNEGTCPLYYGEDMLYCNGTKPTSVVVPNGVTKISPYAFYKCTSLTSVTLNDDGSLIQIMNNAFRGCTGLTEIIVPNSVTTIGADAFNACTSLTSLTLSSSLVNINSSAFSGCTSLVGTLTIPSAVTQIGSNAFKNCSSLTALDLTNANALKTISSSSFTGCTNIAGGLYIPAAVTKIDNNAFADFSGITAIFATPTTAPTAYANTFTNIVKTIPLYVPTADAMASYRANTYWNEFTNMKVGGCCGAAGNETNVRWEYNTTSHALTISGTGAMKDYGSSDSNRAPWYELRNSITSIKICDGVTHVGKYAFNGCSTATEEWMSTTVTGCGSSASSNCSGLTKVKYGKTGSTILSYATDWAQIEFANYQANPLSSAHVLQVYKAISTIPAFSNVTSLENRNISAIKPYAFYGCTTLTNAVLPANVETIGDDAFYGCTNLATVTLPDALTTIGKEAFKNCSKLPSITIPENVTVMTCHSGNTTYSIFGGCTNLTTIVWNARNCASDYIKVGTSSGYNYGTPFSGIYSQITSITFGENVERIPNFLCYHMDHLTSVTIPSSVTNIGIEAFDACSGTMSVICEGATPPILADNVFSSPSTKKLYLPHDIDVKAAYRAASGWSSFTEENIYPKIVQFDLNGKSGTIPDPQFFDDKTSTAAAPATPADDGYYTFDQWTTDASGASPFTFASTNITADLTLYAKWTENIFSFADTDTDNSKIAAAEGKKASSVTIGRTVWKDGYYNTLCLPFSLSANEIATSPLAGYKALKRLSTATVTGTGEDRVLNIQLEPITAITAGEPFLISYEAGGNITNPVFNNVTVTAATPGNIHAGDVTCHGIYARTGLGDANTNLFLGTNNTLYWPKDAEHSTMNGLRAYFSIDSSGPAYAGMRVRLTDKPAETPTGIDHDAPSTEPQSTKILRDGVLLILRDGKTYSAQGVRIQ